jgi:hypothetical protein
MKPSAKLRWRRRVSITERAPGDQALEDEALLLLPQKEMAKRCKEEQDAWPPGNHGRGRAPHDAFAAHPQLEL